MSAQSGCEHTATRQPSKKPPTNPKSLTGSMDKMPRRRTYSNSSASSVASSASKSAPEDQFVFSPHQTPGPDQPSFFAPVTGASSNLTRALAKANQHISKYWGFDFVDVILKLSLHDHLHARARTPTLAIVLPCCGIAGASLAQCRHHSGTLSNRSALTAMLGLAVSQVRRYHCGGVISGCDIASIER